MLRFLSDNGCDFNNSSDAGTSQGLWYEGKAATIHFDWERERGVCCLIVINYYSKGKSNLDRQQ